MKTKPNIDVDPGMQSKQNVVWQNSLILKEQRQLRNHHRGGVIWFTGLSGAGKSTLAHGLEKLLFENGYQTVVLDGDNIRHGLCNDLGFSPEDRKENIRRIGEVAKLFAEAGTIAITAFISPFKADRDLVRKLLPKEDFIEIYVECPLEVCENRDVKGLYKKARSGELSFYTGISSPYEIPENPECVLNTATSTYEECLHILMNLLKKHKIFSAS